MKNYEKSIAMILVLLMVCFGLTACGEKEDKVDSIEQQNSETVKTENEDTSFNPKEWGVQEDIVSEKNDILTRAYIKFPTLSGITEGTSKIAYQKDETLVILDAERKTGSPQLIEDSVDNVFPAYFEQTEAIMDVYRQMNYTDFKFDVSSKEIVTVNDYEMCKYTGKHYFKVKDYNGNIEDKALNYVAYATKLKGNGAYVYWMVIDESEDQSLGKTIENYAGNMAKTLYEQ